MRRTGRYLIAANQKQVNTLVGSVVTPVTPNLSVFSVAADGKLTFVKSSDLTTGDIFWVGGPQRHWTVRSGATLAAGVCAVQSPF